MKVMACCSLLLSLTLMGTLASCRAPAPQPTTPEPKPTTTAAPSTPSPSAALTPAPVPPSATKTATTPAATTPTVKTDWVVIERPDEDFTIALPKTWNNIDPASKEGSLMKQGGYILFAFDSQPNPASTRAPGSISIIKKTVPAAPTLDQVDSTEMKDLQSSPNILNPTSRRVQLSVGEALQLRYQNKIKRSETQVETVEFVQYYLFNGNDVYLFTFETFPPIAEKYVPVFADIAASFKFMK